MEVSVECTAEGSRIWFWPMKLGPCSTSAATPSACPAAARAARPRSAGARRSLCMPCSTAAHILMFLYRKWAQREHTCHLHMLAMCRYDLQTAHRFCYCVGTARGGIEAQP